MKTINNIESLNRQKNIHSTIEENISEYNCNITLDSIEQLDSFDFSSLLDSTEKDDQINIEITVGNQDAIIFSNAHPYDNKWNELKTSRKFYDTDDTIKIQISILKSNIGHTINVYNWDAFQTFFANLSISKFLDILMTKKFDDAKVYFQSQQPSNEFCNSTRYYFGRIDNNVDNASHLMVKKDLCHFGNEEQYPFSPEHFELLNRPKEPNVITILFDRLTLLFCLTSLFDITSLSDNTLQYKINGFKTLAGAINLDTIDIDNNSLATYLKIYKWVYSDNKNYADKLGLVRNILTVYSSDNICDIDDSIYQSIQSSYTTYLKENLNRYIEIRSKILDEVSWISQKSSEIIDKYIQSYNKTSFSFITFFISILGVKILAKDNNAYTFNKEVSVFALAILIISAIIFYVSHSVFDTEITRLNHKYDIIKNRFTDLISKEDISNILKSDQEFKFELDYVKKKKKLYSSIWIFTILVFTIAVLYLSTWIPWEDLFSFTSPFEHIVKYLVYLLWYLFVSVF